MAQLARARRRFNAREARELRERRHVLQRRRRGEQHALGGRQSGERLAGARVGGELVRLIQRSSHRVARMADMAWRL